MTNQKIQEAVSSLERAMSGYENAVIESVTVVAGLRVRGRRDPAMVFGIDDGDIATPGPAVNGVVDEAIRRGDRLRVYAS